MQDIFTPPTCKGEGDVELIISPFKAVQTANHWANASSLLRLKLCLDGPALACGRGSNKNEVYETVLTIDAAGSSSNSETSLAADTKLMEAQTELLGKLATHLDGLEGASNGRENADPRKPIAF